MPQVGPRIAVYGKGRSFLFVWWLLAALFAATGGSALFLAPRAGHQFAFGADAAVLYLAGSAFLALGVIVALGSWWRATTRPRFVLYENAITTIDRQGRRTDLYADLEDLFMFFWGGLGYRATPQDPWVIISSETPRYDELSTRLCELHVQKRGERLFDKLMAGQSASFRCVTDEVALSKSFLGSPTMDHPTYDLVLTAEQLRVQGRAIPMRSLAEAQADVWIARSAIVDANSNVFYSVHPAAVMSFDVLCRLIQRLQDRHTAHPNLFS